MKVIFKTLAEGPRLFHTPQPVQTEETNQPSTPG